MNHQTTRPQTATEILKTAASTLGERGKQYDPAGKQERSMTAIVAAFNAIYPRNPLTVHMGWQFMSLVKMVRGATKPHAESALDQVAYAALAAECVAEQLHQPAPTAHPAEEPTKYYVVLSQPELYDAQKEFIMEQVLAGHKVQIMSDATARRLHLEEELEEEPMPTAVKRVEQLLAELKSAQELANYRDKRNAELCAELEQVRNSLQRSAEASDRQRACLEERGTRLKEQHELIGNLRSSLAQATKEAPCAHNTDEPKAAQQPQPQKAPRPEYVDPFDQYGDMRSPMHRIVGDRDPNRGGLAYPAGKDAPTPL